MTGFCDLRVSIEQVPGERRMEMGLDPLRQLCYRETSAMSVLGSGVW